MLGMYIFFAFSGQRSQAYNVQRDVANLEIRMLHAETVFENKQDMQQWITQMNKQQQVLQGRLQELEQSQASIIHTDAHSPALRTLGSRLHDLEISMASKEQVSAAAHDFGEFQGRFDLFRQSVQSLEQTMMQNVNATDAALKNLRSRWKTVENRQDSFENQSHANERIAELLALIHSLDSRLRRQQSDISDLAVSTASEMAALRSDILQLNRQLASTSSSSAAHLKAIRSLKANLQKTNLTASSAHALASWISASMEGVAFVKNQFSACPPGTSEVTLFHWYSTDPFDPYCGGLHGQPTADWSDGSCSPDGSGKPLLKMYGCTRKQPPEDLGGLAETLAQHIPAQEMDEARFAQELHALQTLTRQIQAHEASWTQLVRCIIGVILYGSGLLVYLTTGEPCLFRIGLCALTSALSLLLLWGCSLN